LFGGLFGGRKAPLPASDALMSASLTETAQAPALPQKTAKAERALAEKPAPAKPAKKAQRAAGESADALEEAPAKKPKKKSAPRKRKAAEATPSIEDEMEEALTNDASTKTVAAQFAPQRAPERPAERVAERAPTPERPTERDVWFSDAVVWTLNGEWSSDKTWSPPPSSEGPKRLEEFREKAAEGKLIIWGRAGEVGVWEPIEAAYWRSCGIEQFSFLEGRERVFTEPKTAPKPGKSAAKYSALMVSRRQVEEVWRAGTMH
jgi:hypothetical protein